MPRWTRCRSSQTEVSVLGGGLHEVYEAMKLMLSNELRPLKAEAGAVLRKPLLCAFLSTVVPRHQTGV